jgi:hypothetical protein
MAALMLVAIFTVHLPYGFSSIKLMAVTSAGAQFGPPGAANQRPGAKASTTKARRRRAAV